MSRVSGCILIVGNSAEDREYYRRCLAKDSDYAYTFVEAESGTSAIHLWQQHQPIGVLLDYQLPDLNGLEVLDQLGGLGLGECSVIMLAEQAEIEIAVLSIKAGAQNCLAKKQITADILRITVARAIKNTQVRRDLQASEALNTLLIESSPDCIKVLDLEGRLIFMNANGMAAMEIDDFDPFYHAQWVSLWQGEYRQTAQQAFDTAKASGKQMNFCGYCPTAKGTAKWWEVILVPVLDQAGQIERFLSVSRDVSDRIRFEHQLEQAKIQLESALSAGEICTWNYNIAENKTSADPATAHMFGLDPAVAAAGEDLDQYLKAIHAEDRDRVVAEMEQAILTGNAYKSEYRVRNADGLERYVNAQGRTEYDAQGKAVSFLGVLFDITERKQMEAAVKRSEQRSRRILDGLFSFVGIVNLDGILVEANRTALDAAGLNPTDVIGKPFEATYWWSYSTAIQAQLKAAIDQAISGEMVRYDVEVRIKNEQLITIDFTLVPILDNAGQVEYLIPSGIDITDRKQAEQEREQLLKREQAARQEAETANRIKDEFLAIVSHELRTPLGPILGWAQLLSRGKLSPEKTEQALDTITRNAKMQAQLINDLLDVSRILGGKLSLSAEPVDLMQVIQAAMETIQLSAEAKSIALFAPLGTDTISVLGDSGRLQQVIWNLLSNAVKFTPRGGRIDIEIEVDYCENQACITVHDTGKGIPADFLPYVFNRFSQEDGATTRQFGGLGLGLAIARYLVELHGGTITVSSPGEGQGATFVVKLPLLDTPSAEIQPIETLPAHSGILKGIRILVVDDDDDAREIAAFVLEDAGATVTLLASAQEVLSLLEQAQFDLLISDIGMPDIDGYQLMQQVRSLPPEKGGQIPAIALTAYAGELDFRRAQAVGFQRHIAKPVEPHFLISSIAATLH